MSTAYDLNQLYRSFIGFDRLVPLFEARRTETQPSYPPYDIELVAPDRYRIAMAVAGFDQSQIDIEAEQDTLRVTGRKPKEDSQRKMLHRGIAARDFEHRFQLADHLKVIEAQLDNGLLLIDLVREIPEALKPRKIDISSNAMASRQPLLDRQAA